MNESISKLPRILLALTFAMLPATLLAQPAPAAEPATQSPVFAAPEENEHLAIPAELEAIADARPASADPAAAPTPPKAVKKLKKVPHPQTPPGMPANMKPPSFTPPGMPAALPPGMTPPGKAPSAKAKVASGPAAAPQANSDLKVTGLAKPDINLNETVGELTLSDMPVNDVLDQLQNLTGKAILRQSTISGTFNFKSQGQLTRRQAIEAIVSLLALNGVAVSPLGDLYLKAVPATSAANNAPVLIDDSTLDYEPSQEVCSKIFRIDFMAIPEAVTALSAMQSGLVGTSITPFDKNNSVMATDCMANLQRMETLLSRVDKPSAGSQKIIFYPLRNVSAKDALTRCQQLLSGPMASRFQGNTTVDADERTNQIIAYTHPANEAMLRELIDNLDKDVEPLSRTEMFSIRHADATDLCDVIKEVITGQKQIRTDTTGTSSSKSGSGAQANKQTAANPRVQQAQSVVDNAGTQFSNYITIVPDERSNNIVATGTPSDLRLLGEIIGKLDAVLPQVRIEVIIAEVTLSKGQSSGLSSFGVRYSNTDSSGTAVGAGNGLGGGNKDIWISPTVQGGGLTVDAFALENFTMNTVFSVAKTNSNVKVLSAPCIVTSHNREASITVGKKEPVVSSYTTSTSSTEDNATSISYENIALELTVKPLIGSNGVVQMTITQKYNEVGDTVTIGDYQQPEVITREATSFVSVANGKMVVLGGLQKSTVTKTRNKVFILGDIPVLGYLFRPKVDKVERTDLLIFIRPVILANPDEADADAKKMISRIETSKDVNRYIDTGSFDDKGKARAIPVKKDDDASTDKSQKAQRHSGK
jgi:general secretion pathway protein D